MDKDLETLNRWRLVLGKFSEQSFDFGKGEFKYREVDDVLDFLYGREYGENQGVRKGGKESSILNVPRWITKIRELFPKETVEILEKHALNKYGLVELLNDKEVLEKLEPNIDLLKSIIQMKHMMKGEVLESARKIVKKVVDEITKQLENDVKMSIMGKIDRSNRGYVKSIRNMDFKKTINRNLKNFDIDTNQLIINQVYFNRRVKSYNKWNVIIAVDESGSMLDSVIHSAVMAGIFAKLPMLKTNLVIFDTEVVDLSSYIDDPVQTLMSVQLGGGTNIAKALQYCSSLIQNPYRTMVVMVTDLYEGGRISTMYRRAKDIMDTGAKLIILTSLDSESVPSYDKNVAQTLTNMGAEVAALTPGGLANWIASIIS
ncbi:VWA domain-containing protein [Tepidibacter hydrothermalis]|uniref:VWA domain-containing protein n=1 Tax=Tepidibacter hydrothermalis TaxID=3036126 RepID=A0ABY8EFU5_9FIRM|nr:VWA domain-containing protein [Tepidibacter hydrothermalis]WFD09720.1 VWA domain-containing protein [Tepidibacter hydrothermalis]